MNPIPIATQPANLTFPVPGTQPQLPRVTHHSGGSWITMPAILNHPLNGRLSVLVQGNTNTPDLPLKPEAAIQLVDSVRINSVPQPPHQGVAEIHVNVHTGHVIWQWFNHSLLLNPSGFSQRYPHLGASFIDFVLANIPQEMRNNLPMHPGQQNWQPVIAAPLQRHARLDSLPAEILHDIGSRLNAKDLKQWSRVSHAFHSHLQPNLDAINVMTHAGKTVVTNHDGMPLIGEDGDPVREYPVVRGQNGRPVVDSNGNHVHQSGETRAVYFRGRPSAQPPILSANGGTITGANGRIVRQQSHYNAAFYQDALTHIKEGMKPQYQQAALNALTTALNEHPIPEYAVDVDPMTGTVTFPLELDAALQSNNSRIRNWALQRVANTYDGLPGNAHHGNPIRTAIRRHLLTLNGFSEMTTIVQGPKRQRADVIMGRAHKAMYYSPDASVANIADWMTRDLPDLIRATHGQQVVISPNAIETNNNLHPFETRRQQGQITEVIVPSRYYDTWLRSQPLQVQRANLIRLKRLIDRQHDQRGAIATGLGKWLVRNIADWPTNLIEKLLFSQEVLYGDGNFLSHERLSFLAALAQLGPRGQIPPHIVGELANRMRIIGRNDWAELQFDGVHSRASRPFITWANERKLDLAAIAVMPMANRQQCIRDFAGNDPVRATAAVNLLTWLATNGMNAPQH